MKSLLHSVIAQFTVVPKVAGKGLAATGRGFQVAGKIMETGGEATGVWAQVQKEIHEAAAEAARVEEDIKRVEKAKACYESKLEKLSIQRDEAVAKLAVSIASTHAVRNANVLAPDETMKFERVDTGNATPAMA